MTRPCTLLGFAVDEGVRRNNGRPGAADGPAAFRAAFARIPIMQEHRVPDLGDVACNDGDLEAAQARHASRVADLVTSGGLPVCIGGGHEVAWATFQGITQSRPDMRRVLAINIDAHFDIRASMHSTSGTSFRQMHAWCAAQNIEFAYHVLGISEFANATELFDRARAMQATWVIDELLQHESALSSASQQLHDRLGQHSAPGDVVYLSICLDVLRAGDAPGVSAPAALGVPLAHVERLVDTVMASTSVAAVDIAELNPTHDRDGATARIAARLAARIIRKARGTLPDP
jgi:formiminoglutamase